MKAEAEKILERLAMLQFGNSGNTEAHLFLEDVAVSPLRNAKEVEWRRRGRQRVFIPPKDEDRVVMCGDNSGVYVHSDGFCTPMGDISKEIKDWQEVGANHV